MILKATNVFDHMKLYEAVIDYVNSLLASGITYNDISLEYVTHQNLLDGVHVVVAGTPKIYFKCLK